MHKSWQAHSHVPVPLLQVPQTLVKPFSHSSLGGVIAVRSFHHEDPKTAQSLPWPPSQSSLLEMPSLDFYLTDIKGDIDSAHRLKKTKSAIVASVRSFGNVRFQPPYCESLSYLIRTLIVELRPLIGWIKSRAWQTSHSGSQNFVPNLTRWSHRDERKE